MVRNASVCFLLNALLAFVSLANAEIGIEHSAPAVVTAGERISLNALVNDDAAGIDLVRAYFKTPAATDFVYTEMLKVEDDADIYIATLPAPARDTRQIDYFLLAKNTAGAIVKSQNFIVEVTANPELQASRDTLPPRDVIVEPSEFASVDGFHGRMLRLSGDIEIVNSYGEVRTPAETGFVVRKAETVRTGNSGVVVLDFDNDPVTVLDRNSELNVRTPTWFSHLAGKAYFAFQRLLNVSQQDRVVNNTVALIGIRGTTFISYDEAKKGVALKEGSLQISRSRPRPMSLLRDGVAQTTNQFTLAPQRLALFQGSRVTESGFTPAVRADFVRLEAFAAGVLGTPQTAEQPRIDVHSEAPTAPTQVAGIDDYINLKLTPANTALGITAATTTVVASTGTAVASAISPWVLTAVGLGAAAVVSNADNGGGSSSSDTGGDTSVASNFVANVTLTCNTCQIAFIDTNAVQDDFYDLYVNDVFVGPVNNPPGGTVVHTANFLSGANTMELRFSAVQCCNTELLADFNNGETITPFTGSADHVWTVNAP
ncbi:MAG: FecR domain-containing protein [Gammaproteobacteria bacterium]|nr:FecR domain-containing protein [Gammaproteobacteria bacterium]